MLNCQIESIKLYVQIVIIYFTLYRMAILTAHTGMSFHNISSFGLIHSVLIT